MRPCILQVLEKLKIPLWYGLLELLLEKMGKLKLDITVCGLCGKNIPFKSSPGNFKRHLEIHHKNEYERAEDKAAG